jgi:hypothetical protein
MNPNNINTFRTQLSNMTWHSVYNSTEANASLDLFWDDFKTIFDLNFPIKTVRLNKNTHKVNCFMTKGLLISRNNKLRLHKISLNNPSDINITTYRNYHNLYNSVLRRSKKLYFESNLQHHIKNPKKTWDILKEAIKPNCNSNNINSITINGRNINDKLLMANEFNNFFTTAGSKIYNTVNPSSLDPNYFNPINPNPPLLELGQVSPAVIVTTIKAFITKTSTDIDGLNTKLLKAIAVEISQPLAHIFNLSITTGTFPNKFKVSRTVPIFKAGNSELCDNYRPISLLSSLSKVLEKLIAVQLTNHLELNNLLYEHQYGFQRNKSTLHNLTHLTNYIYSALNDKQYCIGLFLDLRKALDVCSHSILLNKLRKYGITGITHEWFVSYLKDRRQHVDIDGHISSETIFNISVIQDSILGPILFLIYINDLYSASNLFKLMFADDTAGLAKGDHLTNLVTYVNDEIKKIARWFRANKMAVNDSKTKYIIFHTRGKNIEPNLKVYYDDNEPNENKPDLIYELERIHSSHLTPELRSYKLLGIHLDEHLTFDYHTKYLCSKLNKSLYCINRAKNFLLNKALKTLYYSLIHSHLSYCTPILSCASNSNIQTIYKIQKKAIRTVTQNTYLAHTNPIFVEHKILPLPKLTGYSELKLMHSIIYGYCPHSCGTYFNATNKGTYVMPMI